jgi:hypothetical protein
MSFTIEIGAGDLPQEYTRRSDEPTQKQLRDDLQALARDMENVGPTERKRALGFAVLEALQRRETGTVADSAPERGVDRTPKGKRNLSEHTNPSDDDSSGIVTDDADGVKRTNGGRRDLSKHTNTDD